MRGGDRRDGWNGVEYVTLGGIMAVVALLWRIINAQRDARWNQAAERYEPPTKSTIQMALPGVDGSVPSCTKRNKSS